MSQSKREASLRRLRFSDQFKRDAVRLVVEEGYTFKDNQTRLQLFVLAYNLGNFLWRLALPKPVRHWPLTTKREKLVKIGVKVTRHAKYVTCQLAEVFKLNPYGKCRPTKLRDRLP